MKKYIALYGTFFLYSIIAVLEKNTSKYTFVDINFYLSYGVMLVLLFVYAIVWQRILKLFTLTTAYINKGSVFIFNGLWAMLLFNESFSLKELIGIVIVFVGIIFINKEK